MSSSISLLGTGTLETTNTMLAAALAAVGIPLRSPGGVRLITGDTGERHCFFFQEKSPCGNYDTVELIRAWDDPDWHLKNPEHPFAYLLVSFRNHQRLTDYIKRGRRIAAVRKGDKIAFLPIDANDALQKTVFTELARH